MDKKFGAALIWHINENQTSLADLARQTGVSLDVIKKLNTGRSVSTTAEIALAIAAYYGKTLPQFLRCSEPDEKTFTALLDLLTEEERQVLHRQILGLLSNRPK